MKMMIGFSQFCDAFSDTYKGNFTYEGKRALFDYLEQLEQDMGEEIELDTVALCCEYTQYDDMEELREVYPGIKDMEDLENNTTVIPVYGEAFIIQDF